MRMYFHSHCLLLLLLLPQLLLFLLHLPYIQYHHLSLFSLPLHLSHHLHHHYRLLYPNLHHHLRNPHLSLHHHYSLLHLPHPHLLVLLIIWLLDHETTLFDLNSSLITRCIWPLHHQISNHLLSPKLKNGQYGGMLCVLSLTLYAQIRLGS